MAGTTHYKYIFSGKSGQRWKVEILDTTYAGTDYAILNPTSEGFILNWEGAGEDIYKPILSSDVFVNVYRNTISSALLNSIIDGVECQFILMIYKQTDAVYDTYTRYWQGFILQDSLTLPDVPVNVSPISIHAVDGFGLLKDIKFTGYDVDALVRYNYPDWFEKIGAYLPLNYVAVNEDLFAFASVWYEDSMESSVVAEPEFSNPLASTYVNESAFLQYDNYNVLQAENLYDLLAALLEIQGLQIRQWNGIYLVIQLNTYTQASTRAWYYDKEATYQGTSLLDIQATMPTRLEGGQYTHVLPIKEVSTEYAYRQGIYRNNLLPYNVDDGTTYNMGLSTQNADMVLAGSMEATVTSDTASNGEFVAVYNLTIKCGSYYYVRTGNTYAWTLTPGYVRIRDSASVFGTIVGTVLSVSSFSLNILPLPTEGDTLSLRWDFLQFETLIQPDVAITIPGTNTYSYDDIEGSFIAQVSAGAAFEGTLLYKATVTNSARATVELESVGLGDGQNKYSAGALYVRDTSDNIVVSNGWTIYSEIGGTAIAINSLRCKERLAMQRSTVQMYEGSFSGEPDILKGFEWDSLDWVWQSINWNARDEIYSGTVMALNIDRTSITIDTPLQSVDETQSPSSGGGGSSGSTPVYVPYPLVDDILDYRDNAYKPYAAKLSVDPGYVYMYSAAITSYPTFLTKVLQVDGVFMATQIRVRTATENATQSASGFSTNNATEVTTLGHCALGGQLSSNILAGTKSAPLYIGCYGISGDFHGEHIIIDDFAKRFTINMTKILFDKGTANSILGTDANKEITYLANLAVDINRYGFLNQTETSIGFNPSTYVFTLTSVGASWSYYRAGIKYTISGNKTATISGTPPTSGMYFIYIDDTDGDLTIGPVWTLNDTKVPVATVYFNDALTPKYQMADERHTCLIDRRTHLYEHFTEGTKLVSGGTVSGTNLNTDSDTDHTFAIAETVLADEDILLTLAALADPNGATNAYVIGYRTAATTWVWEDAQVPFRYTASGYIQWDNAGTMTEGSTGNYYNTYLFFSNITGSARFIIVHGRSEFANSSTAYAEQFSSFSMTGFFAAEGIALYQFTWYALAGHSSKGKVKLQRVQRISTNIVSTSSSVVDNPWDIKIDSGSVYPIYHTASASTYKGINLIGGTDIDITPASAVDGFLNLTLDFVPTNAIRTLYKSSADVTNSSTSETDAYSYTIPAGTFNADNQRIELHYFGVMAANSNSKFIKLYFGSNSYTMASGAYSSNLWNLKITIIRVDSDTIKIVEDFSPDVNGQINWVTTTDSIDFTTTNVLKLTFTGGASSDITGKLATVTYYPE